MINNYLSQFLKSCHDDVKLFILFDQQSKTQRYREINKSDELK